MPRKTTTRKSASRRTTVAAAAPANRVSSPRTLLAQIKAYHKFFSEKILGLDSKEYVREYWRNVHQSARTIGPKPRTWRNLGVSQDGGPGAYVGHNSAVVIAAVLELCGLPLWLFTRVVDDKIRAVKRPKYYDIENERRREFRRENRRIRPRSTTNPEPSPTTIREAFAHAKDSAEAMIRFGSLIDDLECYVDNSITFDLLHNIAGRRGGIRAYLQEVMPDLSPKYKTIMRYRVIARNFRRACKTCDPVPAAALLPTPSAASAEPPCAATQDAEKIPPQLSHLPTNDAPRVASEEARAIAAEIVSEWHGTIVSLVAAIEPRLRKREKEFISLVVPAEEQTRCRRFRVWEMMQRLSHA